MLFRIMLLTLPHDVSYNIIDIASCCFLQCYCHCLMFLIMLLSLPHVVSYNVIDIALYCVFLMFF